MAITAPGIPEALTTVPAIPAAMALVTPALLLGMVVVMMITRAEPKKVLCKAHNVGLWNGEVDHFQNLPPIRSKIRLPACSTRTRIPTINPEATETMVLREDMEGATDATTKCRTFRLSWSWRSKSGHDCWFFVSKV